MLVIEKKQTMQAFELAPQLLNEDNFWSIYRNHVYNCIKDEDFKQMYSEIGRPAISPALLAHSLVIAYIKNWTDRETAENVKFHLGMKYALHLPLEYTGFHFDDLSAFRQRLIEHEQGQVILNKIAQRLIQIGLLNKKIQRTDSTKILSRGRKMKRYETVGVAIKIASEEILNTQENNSTLISTAQELYEKYRNIKGCYRESEEKMNKKLVQAITDAVRLLQEVANEPTLKELQAIRMLNQIVKEQTIDIEHEDNITEGLLKEPCAQELVASNGLANMSGEGKNVNGCEEHAPGDRGNSEEAECANGTGSNPAEEHQTVEENPHKGAGADQHAMESQEIRLRDVKNLKDCIVNPHDPDMRYGKNREEGWFGAKVHISETIPAGEGMPSFIVSVVTTPANVPDAMAYPEIVRQREEAGTQPEKEYVDTGYASGKNFTISQEHGIELNTLVHNSNHNVFAPEEFQISEDGTDLICPNGKHSHRYSRYFDRQAGCMMTEYYFRRSDCAQCPIKRLCTACSTRRVRVSQYHRLIAQAREKSKNKEYVKEVCRKRLPVESMINQFIQGIRRSRYFGLKSVHLSHLIRATAVNVKRLIKYLSHLKDKGSSEAPEKKQIVLLTQTA